MTSKRSTSTRKSTPKVPASTLVWEWLMAGQTFEHMREHVAIQCNTGNMTHDRRNELIVAIFEEEMAQYPPSSDPMVSSETE